jgi:hypothetical protein
MTGRLQTTPSTRLAFHKIRVDIPLRGGEALTSKPAEPLGPDRGLTLNSGGFFFSAVSPIFPAGRTR